MKRNLTQSLFAASAALGLFACSNSSSTAPNTSSAASSVTTPSSSTPSSAALSSSLTSTTSSSSIAVSPTTPTWHTFSADNAKIRLTGRADFTNPKSPMMAWSGSTFSVAFNGTAVNIHLVAPGSIFNVFVDGDTIPTSVLDLSNSADTISIVAQNLTNGPHRVSVFKRTEAQYGEVVFSGFDILGDGTLNDLPAIPTHKIEYIGNSITCGYGDLDSLNTNHFNIETEDHYWSYTAVSARRLGAEHHTVCFSGRGMYRNNDNALTGTLPELYPLVSPQSTVQYNTANWTPDLVAINLGTNDFYLGIPDSASYVNATVAFVKSLHTDYPLAAIYLIDGPMLSDYYPNATSDTVARFANNATTGWPSDYFLRKGTAGAYTYTYRSQTVNQRYLDAARTALIAAGVTKVYRYILPAQSGSLGYGADWHPSKRQHSADANFLVNSIKTNLGW